MKSQYELDKQASDAATEVGTCADLEEFISKYRNSDCINVSTYRLDYAARNEAKSVGTLATCEEFLRKYPKSDCHRIGVPAN